MAWASMDDRQSRRNLAGAAILACLLNSVFAWPGSLTPDSQNQLAQAISGRFTDWHPPFMAELWRFFGASIPAMLVTQIVLHWIGIWAFAEKIRQVGRLRYSILMLTIGLTPIAIKYTGIIQKDSLLTSFLLVAFGCATLLGRTAPGFLFGIAACFCRANGAFAFVPLLLCERWTRRNTAFLCAVCLIVSASIIPMVSIINLRALGARPTGVARSLQIFDLAGIAKLSGDKTVLPSTASNAPACYKPLFWDALARCTPPLDRLPPSLTRKWISAIAHHPIAYAQHRLSHFNRTIFFLVPPMEQCVDAPAFHQCDFSTRGRIKDFIEKNALLWPVTWLTIGLLFLVGSTNPYPRAIAISGILYGFAYLFVGVASDFRYFYWTEIAVQIAMVLQLGWEKRIENGRLILAGTVIVWSLGYAARYLIA